MGIHRETGKSQRLKSSIKPFIIPALLGDVRFLRGGGFVSPTAVIMALSVSIGVGLIAGAIPAWKASKLKPVDALRYE
ncbi:hypothetical protein KY363_01015 [Candidatus Woesearchaeota archaeon]|nr:hypothetical protein [Candidatus Woesearchaeota archaeon]